MTAAEIAQMNVYNVGLLYLEKRRLETALAYNELLLKEAVEKVRAAMTEKGEAK